MADLVSPGVSVTVTDESFYATAPVGTVPLVVIATAQDKIVTGTTNVAEGTTKANAGKLELMTSQRDLLQYYGSPSFVTVGGTPQYDSELNEVGLFTAYEYLGIANRAYVIRADVDLNQLEPSATEPTGTPTNNSYWMETGSTWGVFQSDGNVNPAFAWKAKTPLVINSATDLEKIVQGSAATPITQADTPVFASNASMVINGISLALNTTQSITDVVNVINGNTSLNLLQISAEVVARNQTTSNTTVQTVYSLRVQCADITNEITLASSNGGILTTLGFTATPTNLIVPKNTVGSAGDFAVTTLAMDDDGGYRNRMFEKINVTYGFGLDTTTNSYWFPVGTSDSSVVNSGNVMAGWGWQESRPTKIIGSISSPIFTSNVSAEIAIGNSATLSVGTLGSSGTPGTLTTLAANINGQFATASLNANADIYTSGLSSYLRITNYDGTNIRVHDTSNILPLWSNVGISTKQTFFGTVAGGITNPPFAANEQFTVDIGGGAKTVVVPASPNNTLANVVVAINTAVGATVASGTGNVLTISRAGTYITVQEVFGEPLTHAGIDVGYTFGPQAFYEDYYPALAVPSLNNVLAANSVWINTTSQNRGVDTSVRRYINGTWVKQNTNPNTGSIPWYSDTAVADAAFGAGKATGTIFAYYNSDNSTPTQINMQLLRWSGTAWLPLSYTPSATAPQGEPAQGELWFNTNLQVDIMVNAGNQWKGYRNVYPGTDPNGVLISSLAPVQQSTGSALVDYDIWLDTSVADGPVLKRYIANGSQWVQIDNTDQTSPAGILFLDARSNAGVSYSDSTRPSVMLVSDYVDSDAPDPTLYPTGMLLFNTRYSTNNVKEWQPNWFSEGVGTWVTASGNQNDGSPYWGTKAQRRMVVRALQAALVGNEDARAEETYFNLIATPGYPECIEEMVALNVDKKEIAFVVGDTPSDLQASPATAIVNWATNANNVAETGPDGLTSNSPYAAVWYPWALSTNLDGNSVFVPPSMMALRTIAFNDQVAYPWFAPAGFNRGLVTGVSSVGYLTTEGEYQPVKLNQGQRDVLYQNRINPIAFIPNRGLVIYGQKTLSPVQSALDRINVARLICYLRYQLDNIAKVYLFEPNDKQTRDAVLVTFNNFFGNLVGLRAVYDYAVVCDESNNTAPRIDANQLWIDIAIKPTKAIEFIYIPIRILNTGDPLPNGARA